MLAPSPGAWRPSLVTLRHQRMFSRCRRPLAAPCSYGGMSVREMEALAIGLEETMDPDMVSQGPLFIE